jgi:hypothetical protein
MVGLDSWVVPVDGAGVTTCGRTARVVDFEAFAGAGLAALGFTGAGLAALGFALAGAGAWCPCRPMCMPGIDWAWTATGAVSAVAASSVLIIVSSDWV